MLRILNLVNMLKKNPICLITLLLGAGLLFSACNLEQDINVDLPEYESELVVECYIEPGKPYRLLLSESLEYFANVDENFLIENASVVITHRDTDIELNSGTFFDLEFNKFFNFQSPEIVPDHYGEDFSIRIEDERGRILTGTTKLLPIIPIDSLVLNYDDTGENALVLTYFTDPQDEENFYRRMLHDGESIDGGVLQQDFITDDNLGAEDGVYVFGTGFDYMEGDTVYSALFHIEQEYYDFLLSTFDAQNANANPFATASSIRSNVEGGIGIFTGLSFDRDTVIIGQ